MRVCVCVSEMLESVRDMLYLRLQIHVHVYTVDPVNFPTTLFLLYLRPPVTTKMMALDK